jgi:hypothetical protein
VHRGGEAVVIKSVCRSARSQSSPRQFGQAADAPFLQDSRESTRRAGVLTHAIGCVALLQEPSPESIEDWAEDRGPCGNTYVREEELVRQFGEILKQIRIPHELAGKLATVLRESQADKEKFVRTSMLRLQQQQMLLRSKLDRVYEDRLSDAISDELWTTKSAELQEELRRVRTEMERHEGASQAYETAGLQILELAQSAYSSYVTKNPREQARLVKIVVSNSTFDRGSLSPSYIKPFDVFATGGKTGDWLLRLDSNQQPSGEQNAPENASSEMKGDQGDGNQ